MSGPMIATFDTKLQAYADADAWKSYAVRHDMDYEIHVQPYRAGWRVVVFDHMPQVADVNAAVGS